MARIKDGDFAGARELMDQADENINKAHEVQTSLIQAEVRGEGKTYISLLMVHAQDHLMNAMTVRDIVKSIIGIEERREK